MSALEPRFLFLVLLLPCLSCETSSTAAATELSPARDLLQRSIDFHDPQGAWGRKDLQFAWVSTRPNGSTTPYEIAMAGSGDFAMQGSRAGMDLEYRVVDGAVHAKVDGSSEYSEEVASRMVLDREEGLFWRNYMGFLAGMPMNIPGAEGWIDTEVSEQMLEDRAVLAIRVGFPPEVGTDTWILYFDPENAAMLGCRFDRADPERDGETIVFQGLTELGGMRLPRERRWYMNADRRYLGMDELRASEAGSAPLLSRSAFSRDLLPDQPQSPDLVLVPGHGHKVF
ncbi:MAG: DUF6503 family protein [Planctomycetota bacterium]